MTQNEPEPLLTILDWDGMLDRGLGAKFTWLMQTGASPDALRAFLILYGVPYEDAPGQSVASRPRPARQ